MAKQKQKKSPQEKWGPRRIVVAVLVGAMALLMLLLWPP